MSRPKQAKAQLPPLDTGPLRLQAIREKARKDLVDIIDSRRGKKALILDPTVSGPLSLLDSSLSEILAEHGVVKLLHLESKPLDDPSYNQFDPKLSDIKNVLYIVRATVENAQMIASQMKTTVSKQLQQQQKTEFSIFYVPRRTIACEKVLEDAGVKADATIGEFRLDLIPFDDDVLSMELDSAFRDCVLDGDTTPLYYVARSIMEMQKQFGLIPRVQGKGPAAESVKKILGHMQREHSAALSSQGPGKIDRLILIDRDIDMATPMCTQITFEGLIDEVTGIKCGSVPWQANKDRRADGGESSSSRSSKGTLLLNSADPFYKEFRDLPYYITSQRLQQYAREARKEYAELSNKDISDLKTFVKGLPKVMMLDRLSDVAAPVAEVVKQQLFHDRLRHEQDIIENYELEASIEFIEELMCRGRDVMEVLRLLVLLSIANNGIQRRHFDTLRAHLLQAYGHHHLLTLNSLEKCGLLKAQTTGKGVFTTIRKAFRLMVNEEEQPSTSAPTDVAHLYKGYAPLSIRIVECAMKSAWASVSEALYLLPGGHFDVTQAVDEGGLLVEKPVKVPAGGAQGASQGQQNGASTSAAPAAGGKPEVVLVVFIGGATFTEISALRFLSTQPDTRCRFLLLTTKIISGTTLLSTFVDPATRRLESLPQR